MYQIAIYLYLCGVALASLFNEKVRKMWRGERQAISLLKEKVDPQARYIWFHAASLGEFEQGRPLMERLRREHPELKILLTFFSPSGYEVRKNYEGADIVCYLPLDTIRNARRFLRAVRPEMAFFIKYEFWYNYLHILKHRHVPVYSVSSIFRPDQIFFRRYGRQYAQVLRCFTRLFVQNEQSRQLLAGIGITQVDVVGDTRFDRVLDIKAQAKNLSDVATFAAYSAGQQKFPERLTLVVGSSWEPDEDVYLPYFFQHPEWKLIIAPHVVSDERIARLRRLLESHNRRVLLYSETVAAHDDPSALWPEFRQACSHGPGAGMPNYPAVIADILQKADVLIIDCYGLLSSIYQYGQAAYVGGGFGVGIHNVLEAAVWGIPVFFGPNNQKFQEAQGLLASGGGIAIGSGSEFEAHMNLLTSDTTLLTTKGQAAGQYVESQTGAVEKIFQCLRL